MSKKIDQVSKNGDFLRGIADWLDTISDAKITDINRARKIRAGTKSKGDETGKDRAKYLAGQIGRGTGFVFLKLFELISRTANAVFVDNAAIRKAQEKYAELKHDDKKFAAWLKQHPAVSSYLSYYLVLTLLTLGVLGVDKNRRNNEKTSKVVSETVQQPPTNEETAPEPESNVKTYDVTSDSFIEDFVNENWDNIVITLLEFETYRTKPVVQGTEDRATYGPGLTWVWTKNAKGEYVKHACIGTWKTKAEGFSEEDVWNQVKIQLMYETLPKIQTALQENGFTHVQINQILALMVAGYQMPGHVPDIAQNLKEAVGDLQASIDAFSVWKQSHNSKYYKGTMKRRWWCAAIYVGYIDMNDLLGLNADVFTGVEFSVIKPEDASFKINYSTLVDALSKTNDHIRVQRFIQKHKVLETTEDCYKTSPQALLASADPSILEMIAGLKDFRAGKYDGAIDHYEQAKKLNPNNIDAYSELALSHKMYADTISDRVSALIYYQKCYDQLQGIIHQSETDSNFVIDNASMAYLYYNVAMAQDAAAEIYKNQGDTRTARFMYKYSGASYGVAEFYGKKAGFSNKFVKLYKTKKFAAQRNYKSMRTAKAIAFNKGSAKAKKKIVDKQKISVHNNDIEYT